MVASTLQQYRTEGCIVGPIYHMAGDTMEVVRPHLVSSYMAAGSDVLSRILVSIAKARY